MRKIGFFTLTPSPPAPPANARTLAALRRALPGCEIEVIEVIPRLKRAPLAYGTAAAVAAATYAPDLLRGNKSLRHAALRTPYIFRWIKGMAARVARDSNFDATFQMQSLFDASAPGIPHYVYTDHTHLENLNYGAAGAAAMYSKAWIACERSIYRNAETVFVRSTNVAASLMRDYDCPEARVACVHAGSNAATPAAPADVTAPGQRKTILFAGIDWERKGGPTLLAAFRRVLARHPDARLRIVGCAPDTGGVANCDVVGRIPLSEMPGHFASAGIFCLPTRREPFGIVFVEAMWHGLPIVATDIGAVPDMVVPGVNGALVAPGDATALADRLCALLDDPALAARQGAASRRRAEDRYHWDRVAARMVARMATAAET
ncbi:putative glycosyl transferase [Oceanicola granulosus HTCC2516]|uniref:Putative glycosyl transferase n=1 Tax=Oceanicola granulosus (strain ATCC BAA-861 / DSM 15982 / KCTC 12143 / HTCC2516) TaxID=314256 RepID=Q2CES1_OCEGH|nr:glycosyltransferase family 4 protein [Oceanicola granulosus]EAR51187.1 putative glycosyl transferase [Oceanicola granulosus HTCC2516]